MQSLLPLRNFGHGSVHKPSVTVSAPAAGKSEAVPAGSARGAAVPQ